MDEFEDRQYSGDLVRIECREAEGDGAPGLKGHAAPFDKISADIGFREIIKPGAFTATLKTDDIRALWNHNPQHIFGRNKAGTLRMVEDAKGLAFEIDMPDTAMARDVMEGVKRGDITDMSFRFIAIKDSWTQEAGQKLATRTLSEVRLLEISPVTFAAYPQTTVALRSLGAWREAEAAPGGVDNRARSAARQRQAEAEVT